MDNRMANDALWNDEQGSKQNAQARYDDEQDYGDWLYHQRKEDELTKEHDDDSTAAAN